MIPFETCQYCLNRLNNQSQLFATVYLQVCLGYVKGSIFKFSEASDLPVRAMIKQLEMQHFVVSRDTSDFIQVIPNGIFTQDYPEEGLLLQFFCACGNNHKGDSN